MRIYSTQLTYVYSTTNTQLTMDWVYSSSWPSVISVSFRASFSRSLRKLCKAFDQATVDDFKILTETVIMICNSVNLKSAI